MRHDLAIPIDILTEDKSDAEKEASHHVAIATLYEVDDLQSLPGLPTAEQEHDETNEVGNGSFYPTGEGAIQHLIYNKV